MSKKHNKITADERDIIAQWRSQKVGVREIARRLNRSPSSISDELRRNDHEEADYVAIHAQRLTDERRHKARKPRSLDNAELYAYVRMKLYHGWSPEMIAGRLERKCGKRVIHHETIYRYIYAPENTDIGLYEYLPWKRKRRKKKTGRSAHRSRIPQRISIHERPEFINARTEFGHWEGDTVEGKWRRDGIHTETERVSRFLLAEKISRVASEETIAAQLKMFGYIPEEARYSTTLDNGKENHLHYRLGELGMKTYFADPYSSWQRGTNEHFNGVLRRYLPKGTDFVTLDENELQDIVDEINDRPRKCLGWDTPEEKFKKSLGVRIEIRM
jgi:transposase, IS30 family